MKRTLLKGLFLSLFLLTINPALSATQSRSTTGTFEDAEGAKSAFNYVNHLRQELKLAPLAWNPQLQTSAQSHAYYEVLNDQQGHQQAPNMRAFAGKTPNDRAFAVGYRSQVSEVISYNAAHPQKYIDDLMSAIYHRLGLLDMTKDEMGISLAEDSKGWVKGALVANLGNQNLNQACGRENRFANGTVLYGGLCKNDVRLAKTTFEQIQKQTAASSPKLIFWPKSGATVPPVFYEESPDPLPQCNVSGYPVHLQINPNFWGKIQFIPSSFTLTNLTTGTAIKPAAIFNNLTDPQHHEAQATEERWLAFFPEQRLNWNSRYQAQVQWQENGTLKTTRWAFFTPTLQNLHIIQQRQQTLSAKSGETLYFYFPPKGCQAPQQANLAAKHTPSLTFETEFVDTQTLKVVLGKQTGKIVLTYLPTQTEVTIEVR
ncbi:CAP domain-containing protein [Thiosulfativibrio zosterae]|uniref:Serine protease n=1 Tax=Thiosulfativibrio zosterae TaxID=2675053 RepID=A0A6F8PR13_9GAMM|nr:CAP domain-containing protein [Thiosulfativibrio zosterae]BBP44468.1 serine protease [Thiosulfativibrio zosterae]